MNNNKIEELKRLYAKGSKHSNYQILPKRLIESLPPHTTEVKSRFEEERLTYILKQIDIKAKTVLDVGGNTGYFSFELLEKEASHIHYYEGNKEHSEFVSLAGDILGVDSKMTITNDYLNFNNELSSKYDIILLLNVLHHIGDDYDNGKLNIKEAKQKILIQLLSLKNKANIIIFQLGFNWKGNRNLGLFTNGTKKELIDFISEGVKGIYNIESIGIAEKENGQVVYKELNNKNIKRVDSMGEFLNRPIFILKPIRE